VADTQRRALSANPVDAPLHLSVHPSVVFKLGEDLITDDVQALIELVKNAYDADSPFARIVVDTQVWTDPISGAEVDPPNRRDNSSQWGSVEEGQRHAGTRSVRPVQGRIAVTDRGVGMTVEDIRRGWLTVSASPKRAMKAAGAVTRKKRRTPLGDKGLGRLGAQRLGDILEINTVPDGEDSAYSLRIPWRDYETVESLNDVDLALGVEDRGQRVAGTTITIRGLREPDRWRGDGVANLERELSVMVSPYGDRGFDVTLRADGEPIDLRKRPREVREKSTVRYTITYGHGALHVKGHISTAYFRPNSEKDQPEYRVLVEDDNGAAFRTWLLENAPKPAAGIGLAPGDDAYFIEVSTEIRLDGLAGVQRTNGELADPGRFSGEIDSVAIRRNPTDVFNTDAEYRAYVRQINGVRIYRDGFGIRVDQDWLELGAQWTTGTSYYNLRPDNVVGYIDLTAEHNGSLVETTNREGFQDTLAYRNFLLLMEGWRRFTETAQGLVRRQYVAYRKEHAAAETRRNVPMTPEAIAARARSRLKSVEDHAKQSTSVRASVAETVQTITAVAEDDSLFEGGERVTRALAQAQATLAMVDRLADDLAGLAGDYRAHLAELESLKVQVETIQEQLADAWEAVSLGITAEALSHEVHQIADRLRGRSLSVARHLASQRSKDSTIGAYVEHVRSSAAALHRQLAHLNPALRYMRERRAPIKMSDATAEVVDYFTDKWSNRPLTITQDVEKDFTVVTNAGRLTQVLDNLVLNSEFWLREQQRQGTATSGAVLVHVESPCVTVTDTGPGVDPAVENLLFEPFITQKGRGKGRGLGLFVVRQLLDTEGAEIELDPERDDDGRRRRFRITFNPTRYRGRL